MAAGQGGKSPYGLWVESGAPPLTVCQPTEEGPGEG